MDIEQMHIYFREYAQEMGMQTVRAILKEDIDVCLNTSINDKVRQIIAENTVVDANNKVARFNTDISELNGLRTLFRRGNIQSISPTGDGKEVNPYKVSITNPDVMLYTAFDIAYDNDDFIYSCRIVGSDYLGRALRDFCLRPSKESPIINLVGGENDNEIDCTIYTGYIKHPKPTKLVYDYIKYPAKVFYDEDNDGDNNVDCDLPEYQHIDIVRNAVNIWLVSVGATSGSQRQNN